MKRMDINIYRCTILCKLPYVSAFFFFFFVCVWDDTVDGIGKEVRPKLTPGLCGGPRG